MSSDSSYRKFSLFQRVIRLLAVVSGVMIIFIASQLFGLVLLLGLGYLLGYSPEQVGDQLTDNINWQFASIALISVIQIRILHIIYSIRKRRLYESILLKKPNWELLGRAIVIFIVYLSCLFAIVTLVENFVPSVDVNQEQNIGFDSPQGIELYVTFAALVILTPIAEEIIFRGVLYRQIKKYLNVKAAALLASVIFAAAHLEFLSGGSLNYIAAIDTFLLSLFIIYAYEKTQNLYIAIFIHTMKNALAFIALFILG